MPSLRLLWLSCMMIYSLWAIRHQNYNEEDVGWLCTGVIIRPCTFGSEFGLWLIYACLQPLVSLDTLFWQRYNIWLCFWTFQVPIEEPAVNKGLCQVWRGRASWSFVTGLLQMLTVQDHDLLPPCSTQMAFILMTNINYNDCEIKIKAIDYWCEVLETITKSPITDYI